MTCDALNFVFHVEWIIAHVQIRTLSQLKYTLFQTLCCTTNCPITVHTGYTVCKRRKTLKSYMNIYLYLYSGLKSMQLWKKYWKHMVKTEVEMPVLSAWFVKCGSDSSSSSWKEGIGHLLFTAEYLST